ncbi:hypothetical protein Droror1_Dr00000047 [Drosera rotundifolia]
MPSRSYVSMVNSNPLEKKMKLSFMELTSQGDVPIFFPDEGVLKETHKYPVGYFVNGNPGYKMVEAAAKGFWSKYGLEEVLAANSGFFFFKVLIAEARSHILEGASWMLYGKALILQQWTSDLILCKEQHEKSPYGLCSIGFVAFVDMCRPQWYYQFGWNVTLC